MHFPQQTGPGENQEGLDLLPAFEQVRFLLLFGTKPTQSATSLTPWNHKGIVEKIRQSLRHSDGPITDSMAGEQFSVCA